MPESLLNQKIETLNALVRRMSGQAVLVVGDIMLDRFVYGTVDRISPESPVPVLSIRREDIMLGGCGNALASLCGLGIKARIVAVTGNDDPAQSLKTLIEHLHATTDGLIQDQERPTTIKTRFMAGHQQLLRSDFEDVRPVSAAVELALLEKIKMILPDVKAVILSDYGKGVLTKTLTQAIISLAKSFNIPVIVDPKQSDFSYYAGATAITPNKKELSAACGGIVLNTDNEIEKAAQAVMQKSDIEYIVATRSADGLSVLQKDETSAPLHLKSQAREVYDVSGAGDVVIATIAAALAAGGTMDQAAHLANIAGGIAVSKVGTAPIRAEELIEALNEDSTAHQILSMREGGGGLAHQAPLCGWDEAAEYVGRWRRRGLKIGFTNGCFDILHAGHVAYLNETRQHCDRLIVALNRDSSVKILKGSDRPVHNEQSRATVMGALASVDLVILFGGLNETDDHTACALLERLQPDIYFKGGDYKAEDIPESPTVRAYGGEIKTLMLVDGLSTTNAIKKLSEFAA
jgi:D-beta-D-heptose 7-phosphate kinase/D-beta-D-heptose 1-phosphate adenosyltransferase